MYHYEVVNEEYGKKVVYYFEFDNKRVKVGEIKVPAYVKPEKLPHEIILAGFPNTYLNSETGVIYMGKEAPGVVIAEVLELDSIDDKDFWEAVTRDYGGDLERALQEHPNRPVGCAGNYGGFYKDGDGGY